MSYRVTIDILERSEAQNADRLVLLAIGEVAHHDGVGWLPQDWRRSDSLEQRRRTIRWRARCSTRQVARSVDDLRGPALDELETRTAQVGRKRILVYRVTVGRLREVDVDYERLPFTLDRLFSTPAELLLPWAQRPANLAGGRWAQTGNGVAGPVAVDGEVRPADLAGRDDLPSATRRPAISDATTCQMDGPTRAHDSGRSKEPSSIPSNSSSRGESARELAAAAAVELNDRLIELGVSAKLRLRSCAEPERATAWLDLALKEADTNPAGYFRNGFESGEWPSARHNARSGQTRNQWLEENSWRLDADEAHYIVDGWVDLDPVERGRLHERVDEIRAERAVLPWSEAQTA